MNSSFQTKLISPGCAIQWYEKRYKVNPNVAQKHCNKVNLLNLLQSFIYSESHSKIFYHDYLHATISIDNEDAGFFLMHKVAFLNGFLATYYLDRGPVWYEGFDKEENFLAFARTLKSDLPTGFLKSIRFIPEIPASPELIDEMKKIGFKHKRDSAYETSILDLTQKTEVLRRNLKANWRNQLKKSEAHDLTIEFDLQEKYQNWLERTYLKDKMLKKYKGPSLSMIKALFKSQNENDKCLIVRVLDKGRPVSGALFILHPPSATYQIGFSMEQGRKINANNFLLWNSALYLKERGIKTLDLGGMNDKDAKSIKSYKQGMGGKCLKLPGLFTA